MWCPIISVVKSWYIECQVKLVRRESPYFYLYGCVSGSILILGWVWGLGYSVGLIMVWGNHTGLVLFEVSSVTLLCYRVTFILLFHVRPYTSYVSIIDSIFQILFLLNYISFFVRNISLFSSMRSSNFSKISDKILICIFE